MNSKFHRSLRRLFTMSSNVRSAVHLTEFAPFAIKNHLSNSAIESLSLSWLALPTYCSCGSSQRQRPTPKGNLPRAARLTDATIFLKLFRHSLTP